MGFQQGLSGLNGSAKNLDVIGNNIANASTVGFKSSASQFADVYATSLYGAGGLQVGIGTKVADVAQQFNQGTISITNNPLDIAISGEGFFRMNQAGVVTYTRNGQFNLDKDGYVVNTSGMRLTGHVADDTGTIVGGAPVDLLISLQPSPPQVTSASTLEANLDASQAAIAGPVNPGSANTYNHSTSFSVYDSEGNSHGMVMYFQKNAANDWDALGYVNGTPVLNTPITFNTNGTVNQIGGAAAAPVTVNVPAAVLNTGAADLSFTLDMTGFTQYGSSFGVSFITQDGYSSGRLAGVSVDKEGLIQGRYTNGQSRTLGQVLLHSFLNPQGLQALGNNQWFETFESGTATPGAPGSGVLGFVQSGAVEDSNVDLTAELVNLIIAQRMYQANAQTIRAQDQILQTLVNLR